MVFIALFALLLLGLYVIASQALLLAPPVRNKNLKALKSAHGMDKLICALAVPVARLVRVSPENAHYFKDMLAECELQMSPEMYYAKAIVTAVLTLPLTPLVILAGLPYVWPATALLSMMLYFKQVNQIKEKRSERKKALRRAMPHFVRSILAQVNTISVAAVQADLVKIFEDYLKVADAAFASPVSKLITEMKITGDIKYALENFEKRVLLPEITSLVNALIGIHRGEDQRTALIFIAKDVDTKVRELIRQELEKRPKKVNRLSLPLVILGVFGLFYVLIFYLFNTFTAI